MKMNFRIYLLILLVAMFAACRTTKQSLPAGPIMIDPSQPVVSGGQDPRELQVQEKFIEAIKMQILGNFQEAINLYKECIKLDPENDASYFNVAKIFYDQQRYPDALEFVKQAVKLDPQNKWYEDLYGTLLGGIGNYKEAIKVYQQMVELDQNNTEAWFNYAFFLEQSKQFEDAIDVLNKVEERFGFNEDVTRQKIDLWIKSGKPEKAAQELRVLISEFPGEAQFYSMLVDVYMTNHMEDEALVVVQELIKLDPDNPQTQLVLANYYSRKGDDENAFEAYRKLFASPEIDIDFKVGVLVSYIPVLHSDEKKKNQALELGALLVQAHPGEAKAFALNGDLFNQIDQFAPAIDQYRKSIALEDSKFAVWQQLFYLYSKTENFDSLRVVTDRAKELFPDQYLVFYFNGFANYRKKIYLDCINSFGKAIQIGSEDKQAIAQMYANMGDAYNFLKKYSASDSCYDLALIFDPQSAYVLNNYSYFLSLRNQRIDEAKKMAGKAVALAPNTSAYEDTYGWVLYKSGDFAEAKSWLEKALQHGGASDGSVLEHYGDILYQSGDKDGAVQYWIQAREKGGATDSIDNKIADRRLYD